MCICNESVLAKVQSRCGARFLQQGTTRRTLNVYLYIQELD